MDPKIKVVGVGGSGSNTIYRMANLGLTGVELIAVNTDAQALFFSKGDSKEIKKILIGKNITHGLGTGMDAELGRRSAEESKIEIEQTIKGADMVFVTCGLGGGTGSGASPIIAEVARNLGILTVVVVTTPFSFEGLERKKIAQESLKNLEGHMDSLMVISNDKLLKIVDEKTTVSNAFLICDDILREAVKSITDLILVPGIINIDFASVLSIMKGAGKTLFGVGRAQGQDRGIKAEEMAINSPLLDSSIKGAKGVLFSVAGNDTTLDEIQEIAKIITKQADSKAQIIFGAVKPPKGSPEFRKGDLKVTVIGTKLG